MATVFTAIDHIQNYADDALSVSKVNGVPAPLSLRETVFPMTLSLAQCLSTRVFERNQ